MYRIIPAYAGSTPLTGYISYKNLGSSPHTRGAPHTACLACLSAWDHPRIRGEHELQTMSSPSMPGIIPAYAGSTWVQYVEDWFERGSSPHTRGAHGGPR